MQDSQGFPPIVAGRPAVLILGSLPGRRSLEAAQYYAQPQNTFWRIMGELYGAGPELAYDARANRLTLHGIAVWDVLAAARRPGSLDSNIDKSSMVVNDFETFFARHRSIRLVCFNGKTAADLYRRHVSPRLGDAGARIATRTLPSTSPAHASMPYTQKLERWASVLTTAELAGPRSRRR